ncbi:unnamed protein product [Adineta steineri]|uniref:Uncharacterized protein n=1 Tax=Adineta steineri TaxID=433720 RepID=A0A813SUT4_9BILA|nr:unnamed protein product [Adineta steineri]CAF0804974.1 unnamed protein product [Adineta steineri]CAF3725355.1 unnamed protein product [Adineta steineri]CAF3791103.1 unnamed protein product [Adineta steineri]
MGLKCQFIIIILLQTLGPNIVWSVPVSIQNTTRPSLQARDNFGCDGLPDFVSCGDKGACCDAHDQCYTAQTPKCTYASWFITDDMISTLDNAIATAETAIQMYQQMGATDSAAIIAASQETLIKERDNFVACRQCNRDVMSCMANSNPGVSTCCTNGTCGMPRTK